MLKLFFYTVLHNGAIQQQEKSLYFSPAGSAYENHIVYT